MKAACLADIREHHDKVGAKNYTTIIKKYPELGRRTFYRLVAHVKGGLPDSELMIGAAKRAKRLAQKNLPALVPPEYLAKGGREATANIDFLEQFSVLMEDARLLRAFSIGKSADGTETIKNPLFFSKSIDLRRQLMDTALKVMREVYALQDSKEVWDALLEEIFKEAPQIRNRILSKIAEYNNRRGLTLHMQARQDRYQELDAAWEGVSSES
jgi:hypothetical protein